VADQIHYCDRCGKIIPPSEASGGRALVSPDASYCASCAAEIPAEERARLGLARRSTPPPRRTQSSHRNTKVAAAAPPVASKTIMIAGFAAGTLAGVALTILLASGGGESSAPVPSETPTLVAPPTVVAPPAVPVPDEPAAPPSAPAPEPAPVAPVPAAPEAPEPPRPEPTAAPVASAPARPSPPKPTPPPAPQQVAGAVEPGQLKEGLVAHWPFEETGGRKATDATGNGNDGRLSHVARFEAGTGRFGGGTLVCRGGSWQGNAVVCGKGPQLDVSSFTIAVWIKAASITTKSQWGNGIVCKWPYHERKRKGGWGLHLNCDGSISLRLDGMRGPKSPPGACAVGAWMHVAGAYDAGTRTATLYLNGSPVATMKGTPRKPPTDVPVVFGRGDMWPHWFHGRMNDARLYDRALSGAEVTTLMTWWSEELKLLAKKEAEKRARRERERRQRELFENETTSDLANDGYYLTPGIVRALKKAYDPEHITARRLAVIGGTVAAQPSFQNGLRQLLTKARGYSHAGSMGLVSRGATTDRARRAVARALAREKPEVVRICFDVADLMRRRPLADIEADLEAIVISTREAGAVPVLYTIPMQRPTDTKTLKTIEQYNAMVVKLARAERVPLVDAWSVVNGPEARQKRYFSSSGAVARAGYEAVDDVFLKLYDRLERHALGRGADPDGQGDGRADAPARPGAVNVVVNGGFEEVREQTRFAAHWMAKNRGAPGSRSVQKLDRTNSHAGERSVLLWALANDAQPGAFTPLRLQQGAYRVSYWACAEGDTPARLNGMLGERPLKTASVTAEWTRFSSTVTVGDASARGDDRRTRSKDIEAALWFWTTGANTKVWIDDVSVAAVR